MIKDFIVNLLIVLVGAIVLGIVTMGLKLVLELYGLVVVAAILIIGSAGFLTWAERYL